MATSQDLRRELDRIRREIDELHDYEYRVEETLHAIHGRLKWLRAPHAFLLKRETRRRIQALQLRHNIVYNCYVTVKKGERTNPSQNQPKSSV